MMPGTLVKTYPASHHRAFSLVELLVTISIIALLVAILIPALTSARQSTLTVACLSNLRQVGIAIQSYAHDKRGQIPFGPKAPPMMSPSDFYPSTGAPTSLISLRNGAPVGLGLLLQTHLFKQPRVLFCPASDQPIDADAELAKVGHRQAQSSYYYRHGSVDRQFDDPNAVNKPAEHIQLSNLGRNRDDRPIRALVIDTQFPAPPGFASFGIVSRTHHQRKWANILFSDGHAKSALNSKDPVTAKERFTVNLDDYEALRNAFDRILKVLETADIQ